MDVVIIGSGFGGSVLALLLDRAGLKVAVVDSGRHPRFAIGESSTPIAGLVLKDLAEQYRIPCLEAISKYGSARQFAPDIMLGKKRGFSYFRHEANRPFTPSDCHENELLVTASKDDAHSDANWLRSDLDQYLAHHLCAAGVPLWEGTILDQIRHDEGWSLSGRRNGNRVELRCSFLVDASGSQRVLLRALGVADDTAQLHTNSRALFGHFSGVRRWQSSLESNASDTTDHPFPCDQAALHHVLDEGWMWWLRFRNDITSVGLVLADSDPHTTFDEDLWRRTIQRYPSLAESLGDAQIVAPGPTLVASDRLQRLARAGAGPDWAALPNTIGFVDPLHSTGMAQTLCGIERLAAILARQWRSPQLATSLAAYELMVRDELLLVDLLVHGCYRSTKHFDMFCPFSMLYFTAAITYEHRRSRGQLPAGRAFLSADEPELVEAIRISWQELVEICRELPDAATAKRFAANVRRRIAPYNVAGLCDPEARNMYRYTAKADL